MSFLMALVVVFSTMSFTVDMHYCGDTLVDTSIFEKADTCGMEMQKPTVPEDCNISTKNCCSDKQLIIDGQDELKPSYKKISLNEQIFIAAFTFTYINLFEGLEENAISYKDYVPPLVRTQIYKLDESYLI